MVPGASGSEITKVPPMDEVLRRHNPLWGAPKIHGELLKLGIEVA
jgi:hypothetical protein